MNNSSKTISEEVRVAVANRVPPGDRWSPSGNRELVFDTLTDMLEHVFQNTGITSFLVDASTGTIYTVSITEKPAPVEPDKRYSLYGEN